MVLNHGGILGGIIGGEWDRGRGEVCVVDRVVDGDGDLKDLAPIDCGSGNACPHRLWGDQRRGR